MPRWEPEELWKDQDVFIIGGGNSLKTFDWDLLKHELTIGCNDAYALGPEICNVCIFGDINWYRLHKEKLQLYKGAVFTSCPQLQRKPIPWIWTMMRRSIGFHKDALGWCGNIGTSAINLSLLFGAKNTFLLGFDMHLSKNGENNWHDNPLHRSEDINHTSQLKQMRNLDEYLKNKFPGRKVINVTSDSSLNVFPKADLELFFKERKKK